MTKQKILPTTQFKPETIIKSTSCCESCLRLIKSITLYLFADMLLVSLSEAKQMQPSSNYPSQQTLCAKVYGYSDS